MRKRFQLSIWMSLLALTLAAQVFAQQPVTWTELPAPFNQGIDASVSLSSRQALLFRDERYAFRSLAGGKVPEVGLLASLPGWPEGWSYVDSASRWSDRDILLTHGGEYVLYDAQHRQFSSPLPLANWIGWPEEWSAGVDAAVEGSEDTVYFFNGSSYLLLDKPTLAVTNGPLQMRDWKGWPARWFDGIDSADNPLDGNLYFYRGSEVLAYNLKKRAFVKGYPKTIAGANSTAQIWPPLERASAPASQQSIAWNKLPAPFNAGIATIVSVGNKLALLFQDGEYLAYGHARDDAGEEKITTERGKLSEISGWPAHWEDVHAAARWSESSVVLFHEDEYLRYNLRDRTLGPTSRLADIPGWPAEEGNDWFDGIDAALEDDGSDVLYLFRGPMFISFSKSQQVVVANALPLSQWGGWPARWFDGIDGADSPGDGRSYFFRGREVLVWDNEQRRFLAGYPRDLPDAPKLSSQVWPPVSADTPVLLPKGELLAFDNMGASIDGVVDAGVSVGGNNILLFGGDQYSVYPTAKDARLTGHKDVSGLLGWPQGWTRVDAAVTWDPRTLVLFSGDSFIQYNTKSQTFRSEADSLAAIPNWPPGWTDGIDAAANLDPETLYLFRGDAYVTWSKITGEITSVPQAIEDLIDWPHHWSSGPTGAIEGPDGRTYFLKGSEYLPYEPTTQTFVSGFPRQLPGTSPGTILAAWPPVAAPKPTQGAGGVASPTGETIVQDGDRLLVTSVIPLVPGERVSSVEATSLNLHIDDGGEGRVIPLAVSDPAHFPVNLANNNQANTSTLGAAATTPSAKVAYRDDYPVNNTLEWGLPWVSLGADYLGAGYDPITLNPANYGDVSARAQFQAVRVTPSYRRNLDGTVAAYCTDYSPGNTGQISTRNTIVTSLEEYQRHFDIDASVSIGIPKASVSVGGGYSRYNTEKNGRDEIHMLRQATVGLYRMRMDLTCFDNRTGAAYRQKLDLGFRSRVRALPDIGPLPLPQIEAWIQDPERYRNEMQNWRQTLPAPVRAQYGQLMVDYGYWVANSVTLGGQFRSELTISKSLYQRSNQVESRFNTQLEATVKGVTLGVGMQMKNGSFSSSEKGKEDLVASNETSGGKSGTEFDNWAPTVSESPVPVKVQFRPLYDLLSSDFFPEDDQIAKKAQMLRAMLAAHMTLDAPPILSSRDRRAFYDSQPRRYRVSLEKFAPTVSRRFVPSLRISTLSEDFNVAPFDAGSVNATEYTFAFGDDLRVAENQTLTLMDSTVDIASPDASFPLRRVRLWGELSSYGYDDPAHAFGGPWPNRSQKVTRFEDEDIDLSALELLPPNNVVQKDVTFQDGVNRAVFTIKVQRIQ